MVIFLKSDRRKCQLPNELKANAEIKHCGFSLTAKKYLSLSSSHSPRRDEFS